MTPVTLPIRNEVESVEESQTVRVLCDHSTTNWLSPMTEYRFIGLEVLDFTSGNLAVCFYH